jgi:hypothetical protein
VVTNGEEETMPQNTRHAALGRLDAFVGEWELNATFQGQPFEGRGRTTFAWQDGGSFLVQHADVEPAPNTPGELVANLPFPVVTIMGLDDATERYILLYADARNVFRIYEMSLSDGIWKLWRDAPGFFQRFTGTFSDNGKTITGHWELSSDGTNFEPDIEMTYTKVT